MKLAGQLCTGLSRTGQERLLAYAMVLPALAAVMLLMLYPLLKVIDLSLRIGRSMNFARIGLLPLGFGNYRRVLGDPAFQQAAVTTAIYIAASVAAALLIGLLTALLLDLRFPARRLFRTLLLVPWAVPGVVSSIVFRWMFDSSYGIINALLRRVGLLQSDLPWLVDSRTALAAVIVPTVWKAYPLITLTLLAALQTIPGELYEAAGVDGAGRLRRFRHVTWPGIAAPIVLSALVSGLWIFRDIDIVFTATGGGPAGTTQTLALYVYTEAFQFFRIGTAAAAGVLMVTVALLAAGFSTSFAGRQR